MHRDLEKWSNQARFIQMIVDGKLVVSKKTKVVLIAELKQKGFKAIPKVIDATKKGKLDPSSDAEDAEDAENAENDDPISADASAYEYLLGVSNFACILYMHERP